LIFLEHNHQSMTFTRIITHSFSKVVDPDSLRNSSKYSTYVCQAPSDCNSSVTLWYITGHTNGNPLSNAINTFKLSYLSNIWNEICFLVSISVLFEFQARN
jgi:hypothetical protein